MELWILSPLLGHQPCAAGLGNQGAGPSIPREKSHYGAIVQCVLIFLKAVSSKNFLFLGGALPTQTADGGKMFIQDKMAASAPEIFALLKDGAHLYCSAHGDATPPPLT